VFTVFAKLAARKLAKDDGVAGIVVAMLVSIVAFSALSVFMSKHLGPTRELERVKAAARHEAIVKAGLMAYFKGLDSGLVPCPDADQDGDEDACETTGTTSGTLPWATLGMAKEDALDGYGTYYTYVVSGADKGEDVNDYDIQEERELCAAVPNDADAAADPEYSGDTLDFADLEVIATTAGATGTHVPFVVISHGKNRLGGISSSGTTMAAPSGASELANATANPATIYSGPYDAAADTYFDDTVWAPSENDLAKVCEQRTAGEMLNADVSESFGDGNGALDPDKFDALNGGTEVEQQDGQAVFADDTAYITTVASNVLNSTERPLYISAEWTPIAANARFSVVTRAGSTPIAADQFDPGITFRFSSSGATGSISIMNDGSDVAGLTSTGTFTMTVGEPYLIEVYDNGDDVWLKITQKNLISNRASAYAENITGETTGTRVALVNGAASESRIDNLIIGRPMMYLDTKGTGYVETAGNNNGTTTGNLTLEGWFNPRSLPSGSNTATLISQWDSSSATSSAFRLYMTSGGSLSLSLRKSVAPAQTDTEALGVSLTAEKWTHVAVAYQTGGFGTITVYLDGELANTITGTAGAQILSGGNIRTAAEHFVVGANLNGTAGENIFDGLISDVRVWEDVRTAGEVSTWYDQRLPITDPGAVDTTHDGLRANWRFDLESGGFGSTAVISDPVGTDGAFQPVATPANRPIWAGGLLWYHRPISTDVCGVGGLRIGAFRCDWRTGSTTTISIPGENLKGIASFYAKAWGGGSNRDATGGASPPYHGGGGGFAGGLFVNTDADLTIRVAIGAGNATQGRSDLTQSSRTVRGARGVIGANANGASGIGTIVGTLTTSVVAPSVAGVSRFPGCVPAITVDWEPCTDPHYAVSVAPTADPEPKPGYGADRLAVDPPTGRTGAVVMFW